ncbi:Uncharacterised protein [Klebsiella pneumoniae]|nr:Uncharacterised protein [Klebsiella pneumoniae]
MANAWVEFVGGTNDALGASKAIAAVISGLASNMSTLTTAAIALAVVMGGRRSPRWLQRPRPRVPIASRRCS